MSADFDLEHFGDPSEPGAPGHKAWLAEQTVLPGFEQEVADVEAARQRLNEAHRIAASDPTVSGPDKDGRYTLTRTHPYVDVDGIQHRAVTAILTPAEWTVIEVAILADLGLTRGTRP